VVGIDHVDSTHDDAQLALLLHAARERRHAGQQALELELDIAQTPHRSDRPMVEATGSLIDQAHFGHEFRAFTGLTPTRYVEVRRRFLREHPGHVLDGWPLPAD
jgi:hypothetical protein